MSFTSSAGGATSKAAILPRSWAPALRSVLRIVTGLLFLEHGTGKLLGFPAGLPFIDKMLTGMLYFTGTVELVGGILIVLGLFTRPVAFVLSGFMAFGYFLTHLPIELFPGDQFRGARRAALLRVPLFRRGGPGAVVDGWRLTPFRIGDKRGQS